MAFADQALAKHPADARAFEVKARIFKRMAEAADSSDDYLTNLRQMKAAFTKAASLNPEMAEKIQNHLELAYIGEFQNGINTFNRAQSTASDVDYIKAAMYFQGSTIILTEPIGALNPGGAYVNWAFAMIGADKTLDAIKPLEMAVARGTPDAEVYTYLARIYLTNERADDAVPLLEEATKRFPDNTELLGLQLNAYAISGQIGRAIEVYSETVQDAPENKVYRYNYGSLLLDSGKHDAAIEQLKAAVRIDEAYADAQYNLGAAYVNKAIAVNDRINEIDDNLRANRSAFSADDIASREAEMTELANERRELFELAITPLEKAKMLSEAEGRDVRSICQVLFQSYVQTGQTEKAGAVRECAGY